MARIQIASPLSKVINRHSHRGGSGQELANTRTTKVLREKKDGCPGKPLFQICNWIS